MKDGGLKPVSKPERHSPWEEDPGPKDHHHVENEPGVGDRMHG